MLGYTVISKARLAELERCEELVKRIKSRNESYAGKAKGLSLFFQYRNYAKVPRHRWPSVICRECDFSKKDRNSRTYCRQHKRHVAQTGSCNLADRKGGHRERVF